MFPNYCPKPSNLELNKKGKIIHKVRYCTAYI